MVIPVLVITPNAGLGELICQILNETGAYAVSLVTKGRDVLALAEQEQPALVITETSLGGAPVGDLLTSLRTLLPELLVLLVVEKGQTDQAAYADLQPNDLLEKPVYLPDLVSRVEAVIENSELENLKRAEQSGHITKPTHLDELEMDSTPAPDWLSDVNLAAQHLTRLSLESSAQASLIAKGDQIWAYAGELPRLAAEELAQAVSVHFVNGGGSDLARFIRLEETGGEYMLYATGLGGDYVLATVFSAETPFSKIRAQANQLADSLSVEPPQVVEEIEQVPAFDIDDDEEGEEDEDLANLWPMLDDVPPPIPNGWVPESSLNQQPVQSQESLLDELLQGASADAFSSETVAIPKADIPQTDPIAAELQAPEAEVTESVKQDAAASRTNEVEPAAANHVFIEDLPETAVSKSAKPEAVLDTIQETVVSRSAIPEPMKISDEILVDPVSPSMYSLTYACVLIPRFPNHHLSGEVAKRLSEWVNHLTVAFGWRLEHLSIRPEYVQWLVNVPPNTSPGYLMRTIRQHTSRRMFIEFPAMEVDNPSGDFWAPGYLILGNPQPPPASLVQEFIYNTRKRQGLDE